MIDAYRTIRTPATHKINRKKSRFLAILAPIESQEDAERELESVRKQYHDASHHCYGFRVLTDDVVVEVSHDDGEPSGSAGLPILQQIERRELCDVLAVVVRYFGGVKLGVGGLVRAYSDAVSEALDQVDIVTRKVLARITIRFPHEVNSNVMSVIHRFSAHVEGVTYEEPAHIEIALPPSRVNAFETSLREATGARATLEEIP
jgi:uncharacterized YigZ family protein